jgi:hypothetical protein
LGLGFKRRKWRGSAGFSRARFGAWPETRASLAFPFGILAQSLYEAHSGHAFLQHSPMEWFGEAEGSSLSIPTKLVISDNQPFVPVVTAHAEYRGAEDLRRRDDRDRR